MRSSKQDITIIYNSTREEELATTAEGSHEAEQIRIAIRRGRDLCAEPPNIVKYKREKETTLSQGDLSSHSRKKGRGVPLSIFRKQTPSQSVVLSGPRNAKITCPKSFDPQRQRLISQKSPMKSVDLFETLAGFCALLEVTAIDDVAHSDSSSL